MALTGGSHCRMPGAVLRGVLLWAGPKAGPGGGGGGLEAQSDNSLHLLLSVSISVAADRRASNDWLEHCPFMSGDTMCVTGFV